MRVGDDARKNRENWGGEKLGTDGEFPMRYLGPNLFPFLVRLNRQ
jgi:hypothetical protein